MSAGESLYIYKKFRKIILSISFALLLGSLFATPSQAEEGFVYPPPHIIPCLEAREKMGEELKLAELSSIGDIGRDDCFISIMFANENDRKAFEIIRMKKGIDPHFVHYKNKRIRLSFEYGKMLPHEPLFPPLKK